MVMSDFKNLRPMPGKPKAPASPNGREIYESALRNGRTRGGVGPESREVGGWDAYRRWLSRVQSDDKRRSPVDSSLYTWKGYRSWTEKIRRDWKPDEQ